jgi:hypothetical protein
MASEITIKWDGDVPGVAQHHLSLSAFGESLTHLLAALRRIATQMVSTAVENERPKAGRFANLARQLDIEIINIEGGSTGFHGVVSFHQPPEMLPLFADLPERSVVELFDSIERESRGQPANWAVRKYLASLPPAINRQSYELTDDGVSKKKVEIGSVVLTEIPEELASLREINGDVVGVGFVPAKPEVRVKGEGTTAAFEATDEQVEQALAIRHESARAFGVYDGRKNRLLRIEKASGASFQVTDETIQEHIFKRWDGVFARLAK